MGETAQHHGCLWRRGWLQAVSYLVVMFIMGMNMIHIITAAERETRGPKTASGIRLSSNRWFMDDMAVTTETHIKTRWILRALDETATWARMTYKPKKSRGVVIRKVKVTDKFKLCIQGEVIPSLMNSPIKCLGKWFDSTLKSKPVKTGYNSKSKKALNRISKSGLPKKFNLPARPSTKTGFATDGIRDTCWLHGTTRTVSKKMKRWFGPRSPSSGCMGKPQSCSCHLSLWLRSTRCPRPDFFSH